MWMVADMEGAHGVVHPASVDPVRGLSVDFDAQAVVMVPVRGRGRLSNLNGAG